MLALQVVKDVYERIYIWYYTFDDLDCCGIPCAVFVLSVKTELIDLTCVWF